MLQLTFSILFTQQFKSAKKLQELSKANKPREQSRPTRGHNASMRVGHSADAAVRKTLSESIRMAKVPPPGSTLDFCGAGGKSWGKLTTHNDGLVLGWWEHQEEGGSPQSSPLKESAAPQEGSKSSLLSAAAPDNSKAAPQEGNHSPSPRNDFEERLKTLEKKLKILEKNRSELLEKLLEKEPELEKSLEGQAGQCRKTSGRLIPKATRLLLLRVLHTLGQSSGADLVNNEGVSRMNKALKIVKEQFKRENSQAEEKKKATQLLSCRVNKHKEDLATRERHLGNQRKELQASVSNLYEAILKSNGMGGGAASFDFKKKRLALTAGEDEEPVEWLSAGKKCFACFALFVAIGAHLGLPFQIMDEIDTNMSDSSVIALWEQFARVAKSQPNRQLIILTPRAVPNRKQDINILCLDNAHNALR